MIFADINEKGILILRATEGVEAYALEQWWIKHRLRGSSNLEVQTKDVISFADLIKSLGADVKKFREWQKGEQLKTQVDGIEAP